MFYDLTAALKLKPDYSPRERTLFRYADVNPNGIKTSKWVTTEKEPRKVTVLGTSLLDPDIQIVEIEGDFRKYWLMACGNKQYDGHVVGTDIWIREAL